MTTKRLALIGAGQRGWALASEAPLQAGGACFWAVADPVPSRREVFGEQYGIPAARRFATHQDLLCDCPELDGVLIASPVSAHVEQAVDCLQAGVPVFLEKPMALDLAGAGRIAQAVRRHQGRLQVGFNLRYAPFFMKLREMVAQGTLGQLLSIEWKEALGPADWHEYARHESYLRRDRLGSWLLEKCCHDLDLLNWLADAACERVASFGSRSFFVRRPGLPQECSPACPEEADCLWSARRLIGEGAADSSGRRRQSPPLCVFTSGSDLVDHQVALLEYPGGMTVAFSLLPLSPQPGRYLHLCGSRATLRGSTWHNALRLYDYASAQETICDPSEAEGGHGGADPGVVAAFLEWLHDPARLPQTTLAEGLESMVVGCGIDLAMNQRRTVELAELRAQLNA